MKDLEMIELKKHMKVNFINWQNSIDSLFLNCPKLVHIFAGLSPYAAARIFNNNFKPIIDVRSEANIQKIIEIKNNLEQLIENKLSESLDSNKKLLIVMGESHQTQYSYLFEAIIATTLKKYDFSLLMIEETSVELSYNKITSFPYLANYAYNYTLTPINSHEKNPIIRNKEINDNIFSSVHDNYLCQVGANHLAHIALSEEIQSKFVILPIDLSLNEALFPKETAAILSNARTSYSDIPGLYRINLDKSLEQFSMRKVNEIYQQIFPDIFNINGETVNHYASDIETLGMECSIYNNLLEAQNTL